MAWGTIRKATEEDTQRLNAAAIRFIERHGITGLVYDDETAWSELGDYLAGGGWDDTGNTRTLGQWKRCIRRALREPSADGIAYGYVGYHAA